ncbi:4'-phosphopantetheinyl transferase family protein [Streptomyces sp. NPDC087300]|uniref:4'-phosphopantetheinyl transferase family protein n=1 Tax=Streptomyces sp. NPDC087300 TaxID=3365780 RepID=UPI0037FD8EE2
MSGARPGGGARRAPEFGRHDVLIAVAERGRGPAPRRFLTAADLAEADGLPPLRSQEFQDGRALLRWALRRSLGRTAGASRIARSLRGKPLLTGAPAVGISVAHSRRLLVVAVAPGRAVGVDVEPPACPTPGLVLRSCLPADRERVAALRPEARARAFGAIWTVQEACLKATGDGVRWAPGRVPVPVFQRYGRWAGHLWRSLPRTAGEAAAVAVSCADAPPRSIRVLSVPRTARGDRAFPFRPTGPRYAPDFRPTGPRHAHDTTARTR